MENRDFAIKMSNILRFVTIGLMALVFASWAFPAFSYSGIAEKEVQDTISLWGLLGVTEKYPQMQELLGIKFVKMSTLGVSIIMLATGGIGIVSCFLKKGLATSILPLIFSGYGLIGYFTSDVLLLMNVSPARPIQIVLTALTLVVVLVNIYFYIVELRTRPADYYLPKIGA